MSIWYILQLLDLETPLKSILTPPLFIEVLVAIQESERPYICARGIDFVYFYDFCYWILDPTVWYVFLKFD